MKTLLRTISAIALLLVCVSSFAQSGAGQKATCTPSYTNNYVACDAGYTGNKFTTTTLTCPQGYPSGIITTTTQYNTSNCVADPVYVPVDRTCELTPTQCQVQPASPGCPSGYKWTLAGNNVAHCVLSSLVCPVGQTMTYDALGNPSCIPMPVTCNPASFNNAPIPCGAGFSGVQFTMTSTNCPAGIYGAPSVSTSGYDRSACVPLVVSCTPNSWNNAPVSCGNGYAAGSTKFTTTVESCPAGIYGPPSLATSGFNLSGCVFNLCALPLIPNVTNTGCVAPNTSATSVWQTVHPSSSIIAALLNSKYVSGTLLINNFAHFNGFSYIGGSAAYPFNFGFASGNTKITAANSNFWKTISFSAPGTYLNGVTITNGQTGLSTLFSISPATIGIAAYAPTYPNSYSSTWAYNKNGAIAPGQTITVTITW